MAKNNPMTPETFISTWANSTLKERSASQSHFNDLCEMLNVEKPTDVDKKGEWYCFERGASKTAGGEGWADVWRRGCFGWEYKGKRKDLTAAYAQLQQYAVALENPPLLVVSDMDRIIIHTNWTNTISEVHTIHLEELKDAGKRDLLRWVFTDPERLKPSKTIDALTREAADKFAGLAIRLHDRGHDPHTVAHFVNRLVFCMFAGDINLLPGSLFGKILDRAFNRPALAQGLFEQLFTAMKSGGLFGVDEIEWFNGGLFDDAVALPLTRDDLKIIGEADSLDWSDIDPSIFGTLFERGLDPAKRGQLGAHYTDSEKIMMIVRPVITEPLWREWEAVKGALVRPRTSEKRKRELLGSFLERLRQFRVLDPACGSGNFLYLALLALKDIEHRVNLEAEVMGLGRQFPSVGPQGVIGIEINPYAAELARVTIWIGQMQWMRKNGFNIDRRPILRPLDNVQCQDALLNEDGSATLWPDSDVIIGNPPFLGSRKMKPELGEDYVSNLRKVYKNRVSKGADLVCYWFLKAWEKLGSGETSTAGLVTTNSIGGGASMGVLTPIVAKGALFEVWNDEPWTVDGAAVRVAIICFGSEAAASPVLNGTPVKFIHADLHAAEDVNTLNLSQAKPLPENSSISFQGVVPRSNVKPAVAKIMKLPKASFVLSAEKARSLLEMGGNPNGRPNTDVIFPYLVGDDITTRPKDRFIVDFQDLSEDEAALYEGPFSYIEPVKLHRAQMTQPEALAAWWQHWRSRPDMREASEGLPRFIVTPRVSKHRLFVWRTPPTLCDNAVVMIARDDDTSFGILHSRFHQVWALRMGSELEDRPRYTSTTTFETFPFPPGMTPDIPATAYASSDAAKKIAKAAERLNELREKWLNPENLVKREGETLPGFPGQYVPVDAKAVVELKKRTLTKLYNTRPSWLDNSHKALDAAVAEAYGWPADLTDQAILSGLLALNHERASPSESTTAKR